MHKNTDQSTSGQSDGGTLQTNRISPSQFMRELRPEYYSDTRDRVTYVLSADQLEFHLSSITQRNQTHDFEVFCRKLCERTICPNLRAQSGPEGGGDSKADTETFPVSDEIAALTYVGDANGGKERWAFAFSAKAKWAEKVRSDVKGIVETDRGYDRIIFVTNQAARSKDRARIEDELTRTYSVPVTIHDRAWIVSQIIEHNRKDIAFNYLKVGEEKNDPINLGPTDYSRLRQLTDTERLLEDPSAFEGMERQRVTEALLAAKFSRGLERSRTETDGRFMRAIRLAEKDGTYMQQLEAQYEMIWTGFWWYDDVALLNSAYPSFEALALDSNHARPLELLCNLNQLLVNSVIHKLMSRSECKLDERIGALQAALQRHAEDVSRPNNRLEAKTSLLMTRLNLQMINGGGSGLTDIWAEFGQILDDASGLGEFSFDRVEKLIEVAGGVAGNDSAYNILVEKLAECVSKRTSESQGALILLKRAQKLDFDAHLDMIRLLGRAAMALSKKEHNESLIEALHLLSLAYRSAGLLWAARSSCVFAAASIVIESEEDGEPAAVFVPTMKMWAWIALELRHIPDFLLAVQLLNESLAGLPLDDESKERVREDLHELDMALGSVLLNQSETDLRRLSSLPDILEALGLFVARTALLYAMGHGKVLRDDGSLPPEESEEDAHRMLAILKSQPAGRKARYRLVLNEAGQQTINAAIMGMAVEVTFGGSLNEIMVAEAVLGSVEAFFATALEFHVAPHTERVKISIVHSDNVEPMLEMDSLRMQAILHWPKELSPASFAGNATVQKSLLEVCGVLLGATCMMKDASTLLENLFRDEAVQQRLAMIVASLTSYHRLTGKSQTRLSQWSKVVRQTYALSPPLPVIDHVELQGDRRTDDVKPEIKAGKAPQEPEFTSHREVVIKSIIDIHAWDCAGWRGTAYPIWPDPSPPVLAFMFENEEAGRVIFERWRERFGKVDSEEAIRVSIVRHLPDEHPAHYCVLVSSKELSAVEMGDGQFFLTPNRSMTMEPVDTTNLDSFLHRFARYGFYDLIPMVYDPNRGPPKFVTDLSIRKRELVVREAATVAEHEMDFLALRRPRIPRA